MYKHRLAIHSGADMTFRNVIIDETSQCSVATPHHTELKQTVLAINYVVLCCYVTRLMDDQIRI